MKYIRTKDGIIGICSHEDNKNVRIKYHDKAGNHCPMFSKKDILKQADTIEELCDEFVLFRDNKPYAIVPNKEYNAELAHDVWKDYRGAIWTDKGLIYVAKMNDKGKYELL